MGLFMVGAGEASAMVALRDTSAELHDSLRDRVLERLTGGAMHLQVVHNGLDALAPGVVLGAEVSELLPDADLVRRRRGQRRFIQDVERDVLELVHVRNSAPVIWRLF
jgi:hypothetical protein